MSRSQCHKYTEFVMGRRRSTEIFLLAVIFLTGISSCQSNEMEQALEKLDPELARQWAEAEKGCLGDGACNKVFDETDVQMDRLALGLEGGAAVTEGLKELLSASGKMETIAGVLGKLTPFLYGFNIVASLMNTWGTSQEVQRLDHLIEIVNDGFNRMETRFDEMESKLEDTISEAHFWTRLRPSLESLSDANTAVEDYFAVTKKANRDIRQKRLVAHRPAVYKAINVIYDVFDGEFGETLCDTVTDYSNVDRRKVMQVSTDLLSRVIRAASDVLLIDGLEGASDVEITKGQLEDRIEDIKTRIEKCDNDIETKKWLGQWEADLTKGLGNFRAGLEKDLADKLYRELTTKYFWRDWMIVVYSEVPNDKSYVHVCYGDPDKPTVVKMHWKGRYNILVSSVSKTSFVHTYNGHIGDIKHPGRHGALAGGMEREFSLKSIYDNNFLPKGSVKDCKWPLKGLVYGNNAKFEIRARAKRMWKAVAMVEPFNHKFYAFVMG